MLYRAHMLTQNGERYQSTILLRRLHYRIAFHGTHDKDGKRARNDLTSSLPRRRVRIRWLELSDGKKCAVVLAAERHRPSAHLRGHIIRRKRAVFLPLNNRQGSTLPIRAKCKIPLTVESCAVGTVADLRSRDDLASFPVRDGKHIVVACRIQNLVLAV